MMAYRENPDASQIMQRHFERAMKTVKPSVDENVIKFYENISANLGKTIREKRKDIEDLGLYQ